MKQNKLKEYITEALTELKLDRKFLDLLKQVKTQRSLAAYGRQLAGEWFDAHEDEVGVSRFDVIEYASRSYAGLVRRYDRDAPEALVRLLARRYLQHTTVHGRKLKRTQREEPSDSQQL